MHYEYRTNMMTGETTKVLMVDETCANSEEEGFQLVDTPYTDDGEAISISEHSRRMREAKEDE